MSQKRRRFPIASKATFGNIVLLIFSRTNASAARVNSKEIDGIVPPIRKQFIFQIGISNADFQSNVCFSVFSRLFFCPVVSGLNPSVLTTVFLICIVNS